MLRQLHQFVIALSLIFVAACSSNDTPSSEYSIDTDNLVLGREKGAQASFTINASSSWSITYPGESFDVSPTTGRSGKTQVIVTATQTNKEVHDVKLGDIQVLFSGVNQTYPIAVKQESGIAQKTILLYMPGRSLLRFFERNIELASRAVEEQVLQTGGRFLVCYQPSSHQEASVLELTFNPVSKKCDVKKIHDYTSFEAKDPEKVSAMMQDIAKLAPSKQYGLIIGCHGKGWIPVGKKLSSLQIDSAHGSEVSAGAGISEADFWRPATGALPTRYLRSMDAANDCCTTGDFHPQTRSFGDPNHELDIPQLSSILRGLPFKFEYLIFDACFMSNIETLYDLRDVVDYVLASPCEIMAEGFPYNRLLKPLFDTKSTRENLEHAAQEYWDFYQNHWQEAPNNEQSGCIALAVMSEIEALAKVMYRINEEIPLDYNKDDLQSYEGLSDHVFFDLGHYIEQTCRNAGLKSEFNEVLDRFLPRAARLNTPKFYSALNASLNPIVYYSGISFSEIADRYKMENIRTDWYLSTHKTK